MLVGLCCSITRVEARFRRFVNPSSMCSWDFILPWCKKKFQFLVSSIILNSKLCLIMQALLSNVDNIENPNNPAFLLFSLFLRNILCKFRLTSKKNVSNNKNSHVNCFSKWNKKKLLAIIHGAWFHYFLDLSWTRLIASCWVKEKDKTFSTIITSCRIVHIFSIFSDKFC